MALHYRETMTLFFTPSVDEILEAVEEQVKEAEGTTSISVSTFLFSFVPSTASDTHYGPSI